MRTHHYLRNAVSLGTSLTALFLLVRCSVTERDYTPLNIGNNAGSGGSSGSGGGGTAGSAAGQGGGAGAGGMDEPGDAGGQGGGDGGTILEPVPCVAVSSDASTGDASTGDASADDAGSSDAAADDSACECVDGFIRAVDADGDGVGSRACSVAPGLDCDDGDETVTHNSCGGCTALPGAIGEDCLDCGSYVCDGPDALACASKPGPVEDPDCRCVGGAIVARDTDGDGQGTRLCEANPGIDCNDGNDAFIANACGGCESLPGTVGAPCNQCGVYACSGTALACVPSVGAAGQRCLNETTRQTCVGTGFWGNDTACPNACYQGNCEACIPGRFQCVDIGGGSTIVYQCGNVGSSSSTSIGWGSYDSCLPGETCNEANGTCTGHLLLPRDETFDVAPRERDGLPWHDVLNTASDSDYA